MTQIDPNLSINYIIRPPQQLPNGLFVSIQGSSEHACYPIADLDSIHDYESVEIVVWYNLAGTSTILTPANFGIKEFQRYFFGKIGKFVPFYEIDEFIELMAAQKKDTIELIVSRLRIQDRYTA